MTPTLHRSKLFWFGFFGLAALLAAWADSRINSTSLHRHSASTVVFVGSHGSFVGLGWSRGTYEEPPCKYLPRRATLLAPLPPSPPRQPWFVPFLYSAKQWPDSFTRALRVPYWGIITLYIAVWLGPPILRRRKARRSFAGLPQRSPADS